MSEEKKGGRGESEEEEMAAGVVGLTEWWFCTFAWFECTHKLPIKLPIARLVTFY